MKRKPRTPEDNFDLNLAPIMNLVMILIPLLLLSVTFEKVGVINVTGEKFAVGPAVPEDPIPPEQRPLGLVLQVTRAGFSLIANHPLPPEASARCEVDSSHKLCTPGANLVAQKLEAAKQERVRYDRTGDPTALKASNKHMDDLQSSFNFKALQETLMAVKKNFPEETTLAVRAEQDIPFDLLIAAMDASRTDTKQRPLFHDVALGMRSVTP